MWSNSIKIIHEMNYTLNNATDVDEQIISTEYTNP